MTYALVTVFAKVPDDPEANLSDRVNGWLGGVPDDAHITVNYFSNPMAVSQMAEHAGAMHERKRRMPPLKDTP